MALSPSQTILITLSAGLDSDNFSLFTDVDGYTTPFATGISKATLNAGYSSSAVPAGATVIRVKSNTICTSYADLGITGFTTTTTTTVAPTTTTTVAPTSTTVAPTSSTTTTVAPTSSTTTTTQVPVESAICRHVLVADDVLQTRYGVRYIEPDGTHIDVKFSSMLGTPVEGGTIFSYCSKTSGETWDSVNNSIVVISGVDKLPDGSVCSGEEPCIYTPTTATPNPTTTTAAPTTCDGDEWMITVNTGNEEPGDSFTVNYIDCLGVARQWFGTQGSNDFICVQRETIPQSGGNIQGTVVIQGPCLVP